MTNTVVRLEDAALEELPSGDIVIRGVIFPGSLDNLKVAPYQREVLEGRTAEKLIQAAQTGKLPDVELGMRGGDFTTREGVYFLKDDTYIIDGLQRINACKELMIRFPDSKPRIGAAVRCNTTEKWERDRFRILNMARTKLSPNVLLRNWRPDYSAVRALYQLTQDTGFVLHDKVSWAQRQRRDELLTAMTLMKVTGRLHSHIGPGRSVSLLELTEGVQKIFEAVGKDTYLANLETFFGTVNDCWQLKSVAYKQMAPQIKFGFLGCFADVLSNHVDFWRGSNEHRLFIEAPLIRKIALFRLSDPNIAQLAGANSQAVLMLYNMLVQHINSGKRTKHLQLRAGVDETGGIIGEDAEGAEQTEQSVAVKAA